jgi:hypothetical protein
MTRSLIKRWITCIAFIGAVSQVCANASFSAERSGIPQTFVDLIDPTPIELRVPFAVAWQMTTSRLMEPGTTTISQSYRETWMLEIQLNGSLDLASPRGRRPIFVSGGNAIGAFTIPRTFLIGEEDLAALVGIDAGHVGRRGDETDTPMRPTQRPILVNLVRPARGGTDLSLSWSDEEHYEVHLDFGGTPGF